MYTLDMVSHYLFIYSFVPFHADWSLRSSGERTPVETRMKDYIPKNWFLCKRGGQVSTNVGDQETGALKQSPTTFTASRAMEHRDGTSSQGEWYGPILSLWNVADFCSLSMLGELTDIGRKVGQYSFSLCPHNLIPIRLTVNLCVWSCSAQVVY